MNFNEEKNAFKEINHKNDNNCINFKNKINHSKKEINSKEENNYDKSFLVYINNFLDLLRPSKIIKKKDIEKINIKFPLCFLIILIFIKYFISKKLTTLYLCILMILPFCSFILINIIIKEKYFGDITIVGKVVKGYQKGRKMGFPTANLDVSEFGMLVPAPGVYAVKTRLEGSVAMKQGMMNIGKRPTFDGSNISLETNIFDFSGDIYGKLMLVSFEHRIRSERKFDSPEQLKEQLIIDKQIVKEQFKKDNDD